MQPTKKIRVLIADDSPTIRELLTDAIRSQDDMELVAVGHDGKHALELIAVHQPDVVTLDLEMPRMDGLETLTQILATRPTPVIVVSSLAQRTAEITLQALDRGAMDYLAKPTGIEDAARAFREELPYKIRSVAGADVNRILQYRRARKLRQQVADRARQSPLTEPAVMSRACIAIGVSTGGPPALSSLFSTLESPMPPIVVVQHMPQQFTEPFARRLNALSRIEVKEAANGDLLRPNVALIAPGGKHLRIRGSAGSARVEVFDGDYVSSHRPSVDVMMKSASEIFGERCLGVIMTGMGRDGADGCKAIRAAGGYVIGQDEATSDVYGMNKVAFVEGGVNQQAPLSELPTCIATAVRKLGGGARWTPSCPPRETTESKIELTLSARESASAKQFVVPPKRSRLDRANVCVVEDDAATLRLMMYSLKNIYPDQIALFGTDSPAEALARIQSGMVDILVTDLQMPQFSGVDLLRELKRRNGYSQAFILTANADVESLLTAFELGAVDYLLKPIDRNQLESLIGEAVQRLARWKRALAGAFSARNAFSGAAISTT